MLHEVLSIKRLSHEQDKRIIEWLGFGNFDIICQITWLANRLGTKERDVEIQNEAQIDCFAVDHSQ